MGRALCHAALLPGLDAAESFAAARPRGRGAAADRRLDREVPLSSTRSMSGRRSAGAALAKGALEPVDLLQIAAAGSAPQPPLRRFLYGQADRAPLHFAWAETLKDLTPLADELERARFDLSGKLLDGASALLAELRARVLRPGIARSRRASTPCSKSRLELIVGMLRDTYYSVRGDRYVLPVRARAIKTHLPGIVHNASGSGQTLFVEPQEQVELGNQLTIAEASSLEEEQRILAELSGAAGRHAPELSSDVETLGKLDEVAAVARLADELDASTPELFLRQRFDGRRGARRTARRNAASIRRLNGLDLAARAIRRSRGFVQARARPATSFVGARTGAPSSS